MREDQEGKRKSETKRVDPAGSRQSKVKQGDGIVAVRGKQVEAVGNGGDGDAGWIQFGRRHSELREELPRRC